MHPSPRTVAQAAIASVASLFTLLPALSAQAALSDTISVTLSAPAGIEIDPTPFSLVQAAPLPDGILAAGLGGVGDISDFMLDGERVSFSGDSILIRVAAGATDNVRTGYAAGAHYLISGISLPGFVITGVDVQAFDGYGSSGTTGLVPGLVPSDFVTGNAGFSSLRFTLDESLVLRDRGLGGSYNYAEFRIDLLSQPVPEPGQWLLMAAGLAGLGLLAARRRAGHA